MLKKDPKDYRHINQILLLLGTKNGRIERNITVLFLLPFSHHFNHLWPFSVTTGMFALIPQRFMFYLEGSSED